MQTVIQDTKTIAEFKAVKETMEKLMAECYQNHKSSWENWENGKPVKAWWDKIKETEFFQSLYINDSSCLHASSMPLPFFHFSCNHNLECNSWFSQSHARQHLLLWTLTD